tara:strand:+ start:530 stop:1258 length:729 start_codon:yes stop_codon:yes gene_type:complete
MNRGNVLFIILITISLFAALSFAVKDMGGRGSSNAISQELAKAYATDIIQYTSSVEQAVQRMLSRGVSENALCFDFDDYPGGDTNYEHSDCADSQNRVFDFQGGGATYRTPESLWLDTSVSSIDGYGTFFYTTTCLLEIGTDPSGDTCNNASYAARHAELMVILPGIHKNICEAINKKLYDDPTIGEDPAPYFTGSSAYFRGRFNISTAHTGNAYITGRKQGCFSDSTPEMKYIYYHALLVR